MTKKGQSFQIYTEELKREAVCLWLEEGAILQAIWTQLGIQSEAEIVE